MLAATGLAIFIIPMLYVAVERLAGAEKRRPAGGGGEAPPPASGPAPAVAPSGH
jgi:hypothetical protein